MNRKKVRKLLDSVADQLTSEIDGLVATLEAMKAEHQDKANKALTDERIQNAGWHNKMIHTINKAIRQVQA